jgi:hypothetical protein
MKERPILFSGDMVRAILEGRKTQTRRPVKPQPVWIADPFVPFKTVDADPNGIIKCPYGQPGERLWVRERCTGWLTYDDGQRVCYHADGTILKVDRPAGHPEGGMLLGECDAVRVPSIHMPRWASRILLEIVSVRVERAQDISVEDCIAEGIPEVAGGDTSRPARFAMLWDFIYHARGQGWNTNPWVWVIEFKVAEVKA